MVRCVETHAVVLHRQPQPSRLELQVNGHPFGCGMPFDIGQGFLGDAEDGQLDGRGKPPSRSGDGERALELLALCSLGEHLADRCHQAEVVEDARSQATCYRAQLCDRVLDDDAEVGECERALTPFGRCYLDGVDLSTEVDEGLQRSVVELLRDVTPFLLLAQDDARGVRPVSYTHLT